MIKMGKESKLDSAGVIERAVAFFGPPGYGMEVMEEGECCARFRGGGGHVYVQTADRKDGSGTEVTVEGREWEYQIKQFMAEI